MTDNRTTLAQAAQAFQQGRLAEALALLKVAHAVEPREPMILLSISVVQRGMGDRIGELKAIEDSLVVDAYFLPGILARGDFRERQGQMVLAAKDFGNALKVAPPERQWLPSMRPQLLHAREVHQRVGKDLAAFLAERLGERLDRLTPAQAERWREAGAILGHVAGPFPSVCNQLHIPRLPAIPFFDRKDFDWVDAVEGNTEAIKAELLAVLDAEKDDFTPYIAYQPGVPVNQWQELNHSRRWSSYFFWQHGQPVTEHQKSCPVTAKTLAGVGMADIDGLCPNSMFSALAPHTRIPPHHGETNARVVVHLPLIVPDHCRYRVGFEHRRWQVGEVLIFDDSIEHEASNDSDELRVVLIFDVWNPLLSHAEREVARVVSAAAREFKA